MKPVSYKGRTVALGGNPCGFANRRPVYGKESSGILTTYMVPSSLVDSTGSKDPAPLPNNRDYLGRIGLRTRVSYFKIA